MVDYNKLNKFDFNRCNAWLHCKTISIGIFKWVESKTRTDFKQSAVFFRIKFHQKDFHKMNNVCEKVCKALNENKIKTTNFPFNVTYGSLSRYGFD